jgi:hypothetical protein
MVLICGVVWGGFVVLLVGMTRSERRKAAAEVDGQR